MSHSHDHTDHTHDAPENPWAGQGSVLLDIGGDVGALVVEMPTSLAGVEVEIRPVGAAFDRSVPLPHVAVVDRPVGGRNVPSLVYPDVLEGEHELLLKGSTHVEMVVTVSGGAVTETSWSGAGSGGGAAAPSSARAGGG
jgi:hypothetical protein